MIHRKTDLVFVGLTAGTGTICYVSSGSCAVMDALRQGASLLAVVLPILAGGLLIGGLVQQLVVKGKIAALLGEGAGLRGLIIATAAGALTPGGPLMVFPVVLALRSAGVEIGILVTYIAAWSLLGLVKVLAWELPLMGVDFAIVRVLVCLPLPILAGVLARRLTKIRWLRPKPGAGSRSFRWLSSGSSRFFCRACLSTREQKRPSRGWQHGAGHVAIIGDPPALRVADGDVPGTDHSSGMGRKCHRAELRRAWYSDCSGGRRVSARRANGVLSHRRVLPTSRCRCAPIGGSARRLVRLRVEPHTVLRGTDHGVAFCSTAGDVLPRFADTGRVFRRNPGQFDRHFLTSAVCLTKVALGQADKELGTVDASGATLVLGLNDRVRRLKFLTICGCASKLTLGYLGLGNRAFGT